MVQPDTAPMGPCESWDPLWCCNLTSSMVAITGSAVAAATEVLYNLTGQRFGTCTITLRPCRQNCNDAGWWGAFGSGGMPWGWGGFGGMWPLPALIGGQWFNLTCGLCTGSCSCTELSEAWLPGPVKSISTVKLNGVTLTAGTDYRLDDFRKLVRLGGHSWPACQDMTLADDHDNTWSVTAVLGQDVPTIGQWAVGELACEIIKGCLGEACAIPKNATSVSRQGVTIDFPTFAELLQNGSLGLRWCDIFVATYNPRRLAAAPLVFDVDGERFRRVGT